MPKGRYPVEYLANPNINKSIEEIYADIDAYTNEVFEGDVEYYQNIDFFVVLPPLIYEGKFIKGIFFSQAAEFLLKLYPRLSELFFSISNTMWGSYSHSKNADAYFTLYKNKKREEWFKNTNLDKKDKILIPLQDADFTNEYYLAPVYGIEKDIDVLCISRLQNLKNLPLIAEAIKIYHKKYNEKIKMTLIAGKDFGENLQNLANYEADILKKIIAVLETPDDYIDIIPFIDYKKLSEYYSRAKVCVLGSLIEGKNRVLNESVCCNTPVVCFKAFNQYARGNSEAFAEGTGLYAKEFNSESLADTIYVALKNQNQFKPRRKYLEINGRKNFFNLCIDSFPYYEKELPEYIHNQHFNNMWIDLAVQYNYDSSLDKFLYGGNYKISHMQGLENIKNIINFYFERFKI